MSFLRTKPAELRAPETLVLPDSRKRLTRFYGVAQTGVIPPELDFAWGTLDDGPAPDEWTGLRLTNRQLSDDVPLPGKDSRPILQLIYEQIDESEETPVGGNDVTKLEDGRTALVLNWVQFSTGAATPGTVGTDTAPDDSSAFLQKEEAPDDGTLRRIKRTYVYEGIISTDEQIKNNGALSVKTITSVHAVPATPSGYTLTGKPTQAPNGLPVFTYTFAKGAGVVSISNEFRLSTDGGVHGMTVTTIRFLSDPSIIDNPITNPDGFVLVQLNFEEQDGYKVWTGIYSNGTGLVIDSSELKNNGKLVIYSRTAINSAPDAPTATIGGSVVLISSSNRHDRFHEGVIIYESQWAEGNGIIGQSIRSRADGLREQTYVSLGTKSVPAGIILDDDSEEIEGVTKYTVRCMQSYVGGDPTDFTYTVFKHVPFTYPGRAKAYQKTASNGWTAIDVFLSPPVETLVVGTVVVGYQTTNDLPSGDIWQPTEWATIEAEWIGLSNFPAFHIEALRGYRSVSTDAVSVDVSIWAGDAGGTMMGKVIFGGTTAVVTVTGGPIDPGGTTQVLESSVEYAFTDTDGNIYYRTTKISAAIPTQADLPV